MRNIVGLLVAAEVLIALVQVLALGSLIVGQLRPAASELTHPASGPG